MSKIYSILNFKGGTGKSSLTENLADALRRKEKKVLVIDGDRQTNASTTLLQGHRTPTLTEVFQGQATLQEAMFEAKPGLWVVPSSGKLDEASTYITIHRNAYYTVRRQLAQLEGFDFVLIDHAGAYTPAMEALLLASDAMLIPCELEPYAVGGLFNMFQKLQETLIDHTLQNSGIIPYNVDLRYGMTRQYLKELNDEFNGLVAAPIRTDAAVRNAQSMQMTVFEYEEEYKENSRAADDFRGLADDLIEAQEGSIVIG
ncbi:MAG: ParA family protein [Ktedonobacteraceae bacterium]